METSTIFFIVVMLHLLAGFGFLMYKMSGKSKDDKQKQGDNE